LAAPPQVDLTKATPVEFVVKDEPWTKYRLEDGTLLFGRLTILKIYRSSDYDSAGQPIYAWNSQNLISTICPHSLRGSPTNPPPTTLDPSTTNTTYVDFERVGPEKWNVYELTDGSVLRTKLEMTGILRTDRFGPDGEPLYVVNNQTIQRLKVAQSLIKKQQFPRQEREPKGLYG
jgi:hypothetical protein